MEKSGILSSDFKKKTIKDRLLYKNICSSCEALAFSKEHKTLLQDKKKNYGLA